MRNSSHDFSAAAGFLTRSLGRIVGCLDSLNLTEQHWRPEATGANSLLSIASHALANAEDNVLHVLAGRAFRRARSAEFEDTHLTADMIRQRWTELEPELLDALGELSPAMLSETREHPRRGRLTCFEVLMVALRHTAEHMGQAELTRDMVLARRTAGGAGVDVLPFDEFYTRTAQYMRGLDPSWPDDQVAQALPLERTRLAELLGRGEQRSVLDCSCGGGTQSIPLAQLGWQVVAADARAEAVADMRGRAERYCVTLESRTCDMRAVGTLFAGRFDYVISCMALDNLVSDASIADALRSMRTALKPGGRCFIRVRAFDQLLRARPRFEFREERMLPHGRAILLDDWIYESEQHVVNASIFLHEDTRTSGYAWDSASFAYRRRILREAELTDFLRAAGFVDVQVVPRANPWAPCEAVAARG